ncbi:K(+)/H(+) antiporter [Podila humilis]|nr:K(+)/H(+) antiporter [Podila humilis]
MLFEKRDGAGSVVTGLNPAAFNASNPFPLFVIQLKQPRVISEVIAGILLGPSVLGRIPGFASTIFNPASLPYLNLVSTIGLVLFLFLVGLELDPALVVKRARFALGISFAGMALPLGVGAAVSYILYGELGPDTNVGFGQFLLFCGVAMSITAFPVLARILAEQKLLTTKVGFLTICAGAVGDIVAWILLALVVSIINSASRITPLYVVLLSIAWILILVFLVRPLFDYLIRVTKSQDEPSQTMMAFTLGVVLISAFVTDIIGVHSIFGSFLVGLIIPNDTGFADGVTKRIEDLVSVVLLPIYFALSGLKTQVGLLDNGRTWGLVILVTFVACFGKIVGCTTAAKLQGMEWRESFAIGVLMNCKGLIELIVLNIGYDAGVINAKIFVIMVAMCLITTCMTTPGVSYIYPVHYQRAAAQRALAKERKLNGDVEQYGDSTEVLDTSNKGFMLCLDKIQNLPAMMTFLEMLHHAVPKHQDSVDGSQSAIDNQGSHETFNTHLADANNKAAPGPKILALRLLHLTERSSSVLLAATERAEVLRRDTLMTVFQAFAKLNSIFVRPRMTLSTDPDDFANSIYDEAIESGTGVIIFPWNSTSLPDPPMTYSEDTQSPVLSRPLVASNTQVVNRLLTTTAHSDLVTAIFVDREFGGSGHFLNIMVPIYGSPDDEGALKMASAMSHNRLCTIQIVRIESAMKRTKEASRPRHNDDNQSIDSECDHTGLSDLPDDNQVLIQTYFPHRVLPDNKKVNRRSTGQPTMIVAGTEVGDSIFVHLVPTLQDAIGLCKAVLGSRDLLVLGRGLTVKRARHSTNTSMLQTEHQPGGTNQLAGPGLSTSFQMHAPSNSPGLHLHSLPTGFSLSTTETPTHPIDNPLGGESSGLRPRHHLRPQPSSRDLHHSFMTVTTILGQASQQYLSSEVACCLLVVQSGSKHGGGSGEVSRIASSVIPGSLRDPVQGTGIVESANKPRGHNRPLGFESEHSASGYLEVKN